jgi:hypothetical protein
MAVLLLEIALFYAIETQLPFLFGMLCFIWVSRFAGRAARFGFAKAGAANADGRNRGTARIGTEKRKRKIRAKAEALRASPVEPDEERSTIC